MAGAGRIEVKLIGDSSSLQRAFAQSGKAAASLGGSLGRLAKTAALSFAAFEAGKAVKSIVTTAVDFEKQMRNVNSIAKLGEKDFDALGKSVTGMAQEVGQKPKVLAQGLYDIVSSGFKAADATKVLKVSAVAATAGLTDTATSAKAVTAALNAYHLPAEDARKVSDILFQTVNKGVLSFEELSQQMGDLVPAAAPLGVSLEEVGAAMATVTLQGVPAAEAATRVKNTMLALAKPSKALGDLLTEQGFASGEAAIKAKGFAGVLQMLSDKTKGSVSETAQLTPEIRALMGVVGLTGKNLKTYQANLRAMEQAQRGAGITAQVYAEQSKSVATAWQKVSAGIDVLKIQIGSALLPALSQGIGALSGFIGELGKADGLKAKIAVVFATAAEIASSLGATLAAVDWAGVWGQAKGLGAGFASAVEGIDWAGVGKTIGDSISAAVGTALSATSGLPTKILEVVDSIDWNKMGRAMGPGLAAAVVMAFTTLLDPGFWVKNWDLALAVAATAFGGAIGRVASRMLAPFVRLGEDLVIGLAGAIERVSPRVASALLDGLLKLPGLVSGAIGKVVAVVSSVFGRLGKLAVFTLKVLGVREVIDKVSEVVGDVIDWLKKLPPAWLSGGVQSVAGFVKGLVLGFVSVQAWLAGMYLKIIGFFAGAAGWLVSAGAAVISGFINGITSKLGDLKNTLTGVTSKVTSWKGPPAKDKVLLYPAGQLVMGGFINGINSKTEELRASLQDKSRIVVGEINRLQKVIDAVNLRREREDQASAVRDATVALAEARKKGEGVAAAERALQRAQEDIVLSADQRKLTAAQAAYDKAQTALEKANEKIKTAQERAHKQMLDAQQKALDAYNKALDRARTKAGTSFDRLADLVRRGFQAVNDAWVSPAQQAVDAISDRRAREDLNSAVADARDGLAKAQEGGDPAEIADAQQRLDRAREDVLVAGLQRQAAIEETAHNNQADARQRALDRMLEQLRTSFTTTGTETDKGMKTIHDLIATYDGPFAKLGKLLGESFSRELRAAMNAAVTGAAGVAAARGGQPGPGGGGLLGAVRGAVFSNFSGGLSAAPSGTNQPIHVQLILDGKVLTEKVVDTYNSESRIGRMRLAT